MSFKPLLSATYEERFPPQYPVIGSPKLDGIRVIIVDGIPQTRSLKKPVPSEVVRGALSGLPWFDGEVIVGDTPVGSEVCSRTQSGVMSKDGLDIHSKWKLYIFDYADPDYATMPYTARLAGAQKAMEANAKRYPLIAPHLALHESVTLNSDKEMWAYEDACVKAGYEGIMLRDPNGIYKWGRATAKSRILTKIKRWEDAEARIIDVYEEMHNGNEPKVNALGKIERSSHQDNKSGLGRVGGYLCETFRCTDSDLFTLYPEDGTKAERVEFYLGAAANTTQEDRARLFNGRESLMGQIATFKYQPTTGAERPRFPVYKNRRYDE